MLRLRARASMGYYVDTYVFCLLFYPCEDYVNLAGAINFYFRFMNFGLLVLYNSYI